MKSLNCANFEKGMTDDAFTFGIVAECRDEQIANGILEVIITRMLDLEVPEIPEGYC